MLVVPCSSSENICICLLGILFNPADAGCNFEEDLCNFYQDHKDVPGWSRVKVKRNVYRAGDHTTGFGKSELLFNRRVKLNVKANALFKFSHFSNVIGTMVSLPCCNCFHCILSGTLAVSDPACKVAVSLVKMSCRP